MKTYFVIGKGIFGVPSFIVNDKLFFGSDRLLFVEREIGAKKIERILPSNKSTQQKGPKLTFIFDFSSPWAFIASTQIERVAKECNCESLQLKPILLGALFKK